MYPERSWKAFGFVSQLLCKRICLEIELGRLYVYIAVMTLLRCFNMMVYVDINASFNTLKGVGFYVCSAFVNNLIEDLGPHLSLFFFNVEVLIRLNILWNRKEIYFSCPLSWASQSPRQVLGVEQDCISFLPYFI